MVLVTGGTGLVGAHLLLHLLEQGETVRSIFRNQANILKVKSLFEYYSKTDLFPKIQWIQADILDIPALGPAFEGIEKVYHCAGFISFDPSDEEQLRKLNIEGTANIVNHCIDSRVKKLCHVSSIATLGDLAFRQQNEVLLSETTQWNPEKAHSDYAISKYGAEMEVWRAQQEGVAVVIVNPGIIFGPGFWQQGSGRFFTTVKKGLYFYTEGSTGYVAVTDVVKIMQQLMDSGYTNERFIVVSDNVPFRQMTLKIARLIQAPQPKIEAASWLLALAWKTDCLLSRLLRTKRKITKLGAQTLQQTDLISNDKIKTALDYSFTDLDSYLATIAEDFRKNR